MELYQSKVKTIYLALNSNSVDQVIINKKRKNARYKNWVLIKKVKTSIHINRDKVTLSATQRTQFPFLLLWVCTVHKVQDLNLNAGTVSFEL